MLTKTPFRKIKFAETKAMAEAGDINSQYNLAVMYAKGLGVLRDDKEAIEWYHKSAEQGFAAAQLNLGVMYATDRGVPKDFVIAYAFANIAEANGFDVKRFKSLLEKEMTLDDVNKAEVLANEMIKKNPKLINK